jgi:uncharacterized protein
MSGLWQPATSAERYRAIDIIRGLALFGVLMVNLMSDFRVPLLEYILRPPSDWVDRVIKFALEFKSLTTFSFLFGVGIAIQWERASARGQRALLFLLRRMGVLLVLGATHLFLIWNGDILTLYAVCGLLLVPALGLRWPWLTMIGVMCIALPEIRWFGMHFPPGDTAIAEARHVYGDEGFLAILRFRWAETWSLIVPILIAVLPRTVGLMYLGSAAWRSGILRTPERYWRVLVAVLVAGGIAGSWLTLHPVDHVDASILMAMAYVSGLLLLLTPARATSWRGLAALGQMALTNYLMQSIVLGFVFYRYGLGLFGRLDAPATAAIGVTLYIAQVFFSRWWLSRYRFGPFEWLWRSLAYGRRQPMIL